MNHEIKEYEDRWILQPLRGNRVIHIAWRPNDFELSLDSNFRIVAGYETELSPRSISEDAPDRHLITFWQRSEVEQFVAAPIVSAVFFKSGSLRIGLRNGWNIFVSDRHPRTNAAVYSGSNLLWSRSGLADQTEFPVAQIDPWSGSRITAPPWPPRPADLDMNDSDDINS